MQKYNDFQTYFFKFSVLNLAIGGSCSIKVHKLKMLQIYLDIKQV